MLYLVPVHDQKLKGMLTAFTCKFMNWHKVLLRQTKGLDPYLFSVSGRTQGLFFKKAVT